MVDLAAKLYHGALGSGQPLAQDQNSPFTFHNPQLFFVLYPGTSPSRRDMSFTFRMVNGFQALTIPLARGSVQVAPQSMISSPALGSQVLITDGAQQGVLTIDLNSLAVSRQFF